MDRGRSRIRRQEIMDKKLLKKAQSVSEFAIVLAVVAAALIGMQVYLKRGVQGRIKDLADQISDTHYEPMETTSVYTTEQYGKTVREYDSGMAKVIQGTSEDPGETIKRWGNEQVGPEEEDFAQEE